MTNTRLSYVIVRDIDKSSGEVRAEYMHWAEFISPTWNRTDKCLNGDTDPSTDPLPPNKTYRHFFAKFSIDTKQGKHYPTNVLVADLNYPLEQLRCFLDLSTAIYCMHVDVSGPKKKIVLHVVTVPLKKELQVKETILDLVGSDRSSFFPPKDTQFDINWRVDYVHGFERTAQNYYASVYNKNTLVFFQLTIDPVTHQASLETEGKLELKTFRLRECESLGSNFNEKYIPYRIISLKRTLLVLYPGVRTDPLAVPGRTSLLASLFARSPFTVSHTQVISDNYSTSVLVAGVSEMNVHVALSAIYFTTRNMMDYSYCIIMLEIKRDSLSWNRFEVRFQEDGQFLPMTPSYRVRSSSKVGYDYQLMVSDGAKQCVAKLCIIQRTIFDNWCGPILKDSKLDDPDREFIPVESADENNTLLSISPDPRLFETFNLTRVNATKNADYIVIVPGTNTKLNVFKATSEGSKYTYILGQLVSDHGYIDILVSLAYQPKLLINIDYLGELTKNRAHNFSSLILDYNENMLYMTSRIETEETVHMIWRLWQYDIQERMLLPDEKLLNSNETIFDALYYRDSSQIYLSGQKIVIKNIEDNIEDSIPAPFPVEMGIRGVVLSDYFQGIGIYYASQVLTVISFGDLTTLATITLEYEPRFILTNRMDRAYVGYYDGSKTIISMIKNGEFHSKLIYVTEIAEDVISATLVNPLTAGRFDGFALLTKHKLIYMNRECKFHKEYPLRFEKGYLLSLNNTVVVINTDLTESDDTPKSYIMNRIIPPSGSSSRGDMKTIAIVISCVCGAILIAITIISSLTAGGLLVNRLQRRKALNELNEHLLQEDFSSVFSVNSSVTTVGDDTIQIKNSIACLIPMQQLQIMKKISEGAYGVVYYGKWKGVEVAIKRLKVDDKKGFAREVSVLNALRHPSVVLFCGLSIDDAENLYIITEFVPGGTLDEAIYSKRSKSKDKRKFSFADKVRMLLEICNAMVYLHDCNIMHRDLKPANILLDASNNIKLCDFGVSKVESSQTMTGVNYGTLEYMAVEIIQDNTHYSQKCDVYSFGIMMHELFFMEKPYSSFQLDESSSSGSSSGSLSNNNNSIFSLGFKVLEGTRPFIPEVLIGSKDAIDNMSDSELDDMFEWFERSNYIPKSLNLQDQSKKRQYCKAMVLFIHLCQQCWNKKPDIRPSFEEIIPLLIQVRDAIPPQ